MADWSQVSAEQVLRATERANASVRSTGEYIVASHTQLLATVDEAEIDLPMQMLASQADELERLLGTRDVF